MHFTHSSFRTAYGCQAPISHGANRWPSAPLPDFQTSRLILCLHAFKENSFIIIKLKIGCTFSGFLSGVVTMDAESRHGEVVLTFLDSGYVSMACCCDGAVGTCPFEPLFWVKGGAGWFWAALVDSEGDTGCVFGLKVLAVTGRFFFSDGSSFLQFSAGRLTPPTPPTMETRSYLIQKPSCITS